MARLIFLAALWLCFLPQVAFAGAEQTTWRPGDVAGFRGWCTAPGPLADIARAPFGRRADVIGAYVDAGQCVDLPSPLFTVAVIEEWVSGPHRLDYPGGRHETVSIWRLVGPTPRYVLMDDDGGDHNAVPERGI